MPDLPRIPTPRTSTLTPHIASRKQSQTRAELQPLCVDNGRPGTEHGGTLHHSWKSLGRTTSGFCKHPAHHAQPWRIAPHDIWNRLRLPTQSKGATGTHVTQSSHNTCSATLTTGSRSRPRMHPLQAQLANHATRDLFGTGRQSGAGGPKDLARPTIAHADFRATQNHVTRQRGRCHHSPSHWERGDMEGTPHRHRGTSGGATMNWCLSSATSRRDCVMSFFMAKMSEPSSEEPFQLT